jgi:hypothetical protein
MSPGPTTSKHGACECGAVQYEVTGPMRKVVYCHCSQCRRTSGHYVAATACAAEDLQTHKDAGLSWYRSSSFAERGFCKTCGSSIFWRPDHGEYVAIMAGTLDVPTGLASREHIHVADASDYYTLADKLPQFRQSHETLWEDGGA